MVTRQRDVCANRKKRLARPDGATCRAISLLNGPHDSTARSARNSDTPRFRVNIVVIY